MSSVSPFIITSFLLCIVVVGTGYSNTEYEQSEKVWYIFKRGRPDKGWIEMSEIQQTVAKKWNFKIHYVYGSGSLERDREIKEDCAKKNKKFYNLMKSEYGENWQQTFSKEVAAVIKKTAE